MDGHTQINDTKYNVSETKFNPQDPKIRKEIITLIADYLRCEDYHASALVLQQEADIKLPSSTSLEVQLVKQNLYKRMKKVILEGDWNEVERLSLKYAFKNHKSFLYAIYKQKYFELIERQEYQKAFSYLTERLKPLESRQSAPEEFKDLCYLLVCKSVQDAPSFKAWDSDKASSREKLVEQFQSMIGLDSNNHTVASNCRLLELVRQSITYQVEQNSIHSTVVPQIKTLLKDYAGFILPNSLKTNFFGHKDNVKCVEFVGKEGNLLVSGSSDNTLRLWETKTGKCVSRLRGHASRIWDVASNLDGSTIASASGDSTVKLWKIPDDLENNIVECSSTLSGHQGDVYTVRFHPGQQHVVTGGYDKTVRLFDVNTGALKRTFTGHHSSVSRAIFNPSGNLIITGSKDSTIKFWDITSGLCIRTISSHLGEVTSIEINADGSLLLSGSKDNSNRLWETSTARPITRFKGHQNTSKNFVRSTFGPDELLVIGGSEDGVVYIWELETGNVLQKLTGHNGMVYSAAWNQKQSLLASCSHDGTVKTWWYDKSKRD